MPGAAWATPKPAVTVRTFLVNGLRQALADETPLHGEVGGFVDGKRFVHAPTYRAMVDDDLVAIAAKAILLLAALIAGTETHIPDDEVRGVEIDLVILDANAIAGRGLAGDGEIGVANLEFRFERDSARNAEDHEARPLGLDGRAKAARPTVIEIRNLDRPPAAPAGSVFAKTFSAGKCGRVGWTQIRQRHRACQIVILQVTAPTRG